MMTDGLTSEEAYQIKIKQLEQVVKDQNLALDAAKKRIDGIEANEKDRLIEDITGRSSFKSEDLAGKSNDTLRTISLSLDAAGVSKGAVGVAKQADERKFTSGLSVGRWDPTKKEWVGGI